MKILSISVVFPPAWHYGGTPVTAHALAKAMIHQGHEVFALCTGDEEKDGAPVLDEPTCWDEVPVIYCSRKSNLIPFYSPSLRRQVSRLAPSYDVASIRSSWTYVGPAASRECLRKHTPYLAYAEGNFDPWALNRNRVKKIIFWRLFDEGFFKKASVIVALTKSEAESISRMGLTNRIEIIPNGINVNDFAEGSTREELESVFPEIRGRRLLLFMSRIHPKKGLANLVKAFKEIHSVNSDTLLLIAGSDEKGHKKEVETSVQQLGLTDHVLFVGPVTGKLKAGFLKSSDLFVLPSYSEGFPVVVLEALACELPVILTKECHVPEVAEAGAGIEVDPSPEQIAREAGALLTDDLARIQMGKSGYKLATQQFNWDRIAKMTVDLCIQIAS